MQSIRKGLVKRIHVSQVNLRANRKDGKKRPCFTIQTSKGPIKARRVEILGGSSLVQGEKPLSCGARIWIETWATVVYWGARPPGGLASRTKAY